MQAEAVAPNPRASRAGWGWLLLTTASRTYLVLLASLAASALLPMLAGWSGSVVQSGSMEPNISAGDVVLSQAMTPGMPAPIGRVVTFAAPAGSATRGVILHRLLRQNSDGSLVTAGDANASDDSTPLARSDIISRARLLIPGIGLPAFWLQTGDLLPLGSAVLLTTGAILVDATGAARRLRPARPRRPIPSGRQGVGAAVAPVALSVVALLVVSAGVLLPFGQAAAAFSATTSTAANSWAAAKATTLAFTRSPSDTPATTVFAMQPQVAAQDDHGATVTLSAASVILAITTPAGATLSCAADPSTAASGVATFAGCRIDRPGTYTLTATSAGLGTAVSVGFTVTAAPAARLAFARSPSDAATDGVFTVQPVVAIQDAGGNTVVGSAAAVTLSVTNPAGATLVCSANPKAASAGLATFAGCKIDKEGTYTLTATAGTLTTAVSSSFAITGAPAAKLAFTTSPAGATGGVVFTTQPVVAIQDAGGNAVLGSVAQVTLTIKNPQGAVLGCTANPATAVAGVTTFAGCKIDKQGTYTLTATSGSLTAADSSSVTVAVGAAAKLGFTTNPSGSTGGVAFTTQPVVAVQDAGGNTVTTGSPSVSLTITTSSGAVLACATNPKSATSGVATFVGCNINKTGSYTLTATSGALNGASTGFTTTAGPAKKIVFGTPGSGSTGGVAFTTQPVAVLQDAGGNNTGGSNTVTVQLDSSTVGFTCNATSVNAVGGVATFSGCKIDKQGSYVLTVTGFGLTNTPNSGIVTAVGPAAKLAFTTQPSSAVANSIFATQPAVSVQDAGGNTVTGSAAPVTLGITTSAGAVLTCATNPQSAASGVATFSGCAINQKGTFTLTGTSGLLTGPVSIGFTIS